MLKTSLLLLISLILVLNSHEARTKKVKLILESNYEPNNENDEYAVKSSSEEEEDFDYRPAHYQPKQEESKQGENCCSKFRFTYLGNCCCKWLIPDYSEFPFKFSKSFTSGQDQFWTCLDCEYGFRCS